MADCQLVKSLSWSSLPYALAFLFISISTKCFLLYDKAKLKPIFTLLGEQLLKSQLDHSCHTAILLCTACHQLQQSLLWQWKGTVEGSHSTQCIDQFIQVEQWKLWPGMFYIFYDDDHLLHKQIHVLSGRMGWFHILAHSNQHIYTLSEVLQPKLFIQ